MAKDYATLPYTQVRRADRAVEDEPWIKALLHQAPWGVMATVHNAQPFINSNLFVYDEPNQAIYLHTAKAGRTRTNIEANNGVCFSVSRMGRLLPAEEALEFSVEYQGVTIFGRVYLIEEETEAKRALQMLLDKYFPHLQPDEDYRGITPEELRRTSVYRLEITEWSGKKKEVAPDFPGAFFYDDRVSISAADRPVNSTISATE